MTLQTPINIFIADDKKDICDTLEETIKTESRKYGINYITDLRFSKAFTDHAFKHGSDLIDNGLRPDICIFDLIFNGDTGVDLYKYMVSVIKNKDINLCIYTGTEKDFQKRKDAEIIASESNGSVTVIQKPMVSDVLDWVGTIFENVYGFQKQIEEHDPFDLI